MDSSLWRRRTKSTVLDKVLPRLGEVVSSLPPFDATCTISELFWGRSCSGTGRTFEREEFLLIYSKQKASFVLSNKNRFRNLKSTPPPHFFLVRTWWVFSEGGKVFRVFTGVIENVCRDSEGELELWGGGLGTYYKTWSFRDWYISSQKYWGLREWNTLAGNFPAPGGTEMKLFFLSVHRKEIKKYEASHNCGL